MASQQIQLLKQQIVRGHEVRYLYANRETLLADAERVNRVTGASLLPFDNLSALFRVFNILEPVRELSSEHRRLWAPDLVQPSLHTFISPWVMAGDPCVAQTRIPTASIHALRESVDRRVRRLLSCIQD